MIIQKKELVNGQNIKPALFFKFKVLITDKSNKNSNKIDAVSSLSSNSNSDP